ncbi:MAG: glycosyltransferase family 9 protein [Pseudoalteromonas sp.]|uniref:glycosyltransferase family 9 protein n=1 Tax=unclassified Pseudoalteromonas TaxID=194690 RepID=UPI003F947E2E
MRKNNQLNNSQITGNILIVLPTFIGDAINCTPALQLIEKLYPNQKIILLVRPQFVELFERDLNYSIIPDERFKSSNSVSMLAQAKQLRAANIQIAFIMRNSLSEAILCFLANIKYRVGYAKNGRSPLLTHKLKLNKNHHYIYRYCRLVNELHGNPFSIMPSTLLTKETSNLVLKQEKKSIGVYFGGQNKGLRHYPHDLALESLEEVAKNIDCTFYLFGDPSEKEDALYIHNQLINKNIESTILAGKTSIAAMVDAIAAVDLMITIDSGPMHIAAAFNVPFVAVVGLGTSPWSIVDPKMINKIALVANGQQLLQNEIIKAIEPRQIAQAVQTLLN